MIDYLRRLFAYDDWANREVLAALRNVPNPPARSLKLIAHILSAEGLWLARINQEKPSLPVWPDSHSRSAKLKGTRSAPHGGLTSRNAERPICRIRSGT